MPRTLYRLDPAGWPVPVPFRPSAERSKAKGHSTETSKRRGYRVEKHPGYWALVWCDMGDWDNAQTVGRYPTEQEAERAGRERARLMVSDE